MMTVNEGVATEAKGQDQRPREDDLSRVIWTLKQSAKGFDIMQSSRLLA